MITIFSTCKPMKGQAAVWQTNALKSWLLFTSSVILFGADAGVKKMANELGCIHVPDVARNEYDRPHINAMFGRAQEIGHGSLFCYINADNMVTGLTDAFGHVARKFPHFMLIGKRWDWLYPSAINFEEWRNKHRKGSLHNEWALEYFGFSRGLFRDLPSFVVGWPGWDNWLVLHALRLEVPVIDVTKVVTCVHQKHRSSWPSDKKNPQYKWNLDLASDLLVRGARGSVNAATWILEKDGKIRPR